MEQRRCELNVTIRRNDAVSHF